MTQNLIGVTTMQPQALASTQLASTTPTAVYTVPASTSAIIKQGLLANISGQVIVLSAALSTGGAITALPINPLPYGLLSGSSITLLDGLNMQTWVTTADALAGATSLAVASQTPNFAYPAGPGQTVIQSVNGQTVQVSVHHVPNGGTLNGSHLVLSYPLAPGDTLSLTSFLAGMNLGPGDAIYVGASVANAINVSITGVVSS